MTRAPLLSRLLRRWHRRIGLAAAGFFSILAITGLLLNHGDSFALDSLRVGTPWLMNWYGLKPAVPERGFAEDGLLFVAQGETWVLGGHSLKAGHGEPVGMVHAAGLVWIATNDEIDIFDAAGRPVDIIERDLLPGTPLRRIGSRNGQLLAIIGGDSFATSDGISWKRLARDESAAWSHPQALSVGEQQALAPFFAPTLPFQRIVADVHSGRIFGRYGILLVDGLAVALLLLAGSGVWIYLKNRGSRTRATKSAAIAKPPDLR